MYKSCTLNDIQQTLHCTNCPSHPLEIRTEDGAYLTKQAKPHKSLASKMDGSPPGKVSPGNFVASFCDNIIDNFQTF